MAHEIEVGQHLDDRFEILDVISRSGMASIFKARDGRTGDLVAVKVPFMQYECDPAFHARFTREEEIGRTLDHPSIVRVVKVDPKARTRPYIAMELLSGRTLDEVLAAEKPSPIHRAVPIAAAVCDALDHMHKLGIVHRDLKPQNIMVCDDGSVRIMDFGIAKAAGMRRITFTGFSSAMGTPDYMAPEQVRGKRGDERSDIYSLGAILYEMVTGHTPFEGGDPFVVMQSRLTGDPVAPASLNGEISPALQEVILHAMERDPARRFAGAEHMRHELLHPSAVEITDRVERLEKPRLATSNAGLWRYIVLALTPILLAIIAFLMLHR